MLSDWERNLCACKGPHARTLREVLYAVACAADEPLHVRDFIRAAERDFGAHMSAPTANAVLSPDQRFCWAGKGLYGLYRHGPLPGPRTLEQATRVVLVAAGEPLNNEVVDFCLKQLGYRYNVASLRNGVSKSYRISWDWYGTWDHSRGEAAERTLCQEIPVVRPTNLQAWNALRDQTGVQVRAAVAERTARLAALADPNRFGMNWEG
jgi:hypothetical protein